jgi:Ca2+:H+ antiporter
VALIATIMLGEKEVPTLARDTVFAVVMIERGRWCSV